MSDLATHVRRILRALGKNCSTAIEISIHRDIMNQLLFPKRKSLLAYSPAIALSFVVWYQILRQLHRPLSRYSRWYRALAKSEQQFVRAYILRSIWTVQAVWTSFRVLWHPHHRKERLDKVHGWSRL